MDKCGWIELEVYPFVWSSNMVTINCNTIISAPTIAYTMSANAEPEGIYSYNVENNDWNLFIKYPKDLVSSSHALAYNENKKELYLFGVQGNIVKFDVCNKQCKNDVIQQVINCGSYPSSLFVNNKFHIIGGWKNPSHLIYDEDTNAFETLHHLSIAKMSTQQVIYSQLRNMIILFASFDNTHGIYVYNTQKKEWIVSDTKLPNNISDIGCVLTNDERFVIIFGGFTDEYDYSNKIFVMDLDKMEINESKILCPIASAFRVATYYDNRDKKYNFLVSGYIRKCGMKQIPKGILQIVETFCINDYVHLIDKQSGKHWRMCIDEILLNIL